MSPTWHLRDERPRKQRPGPNTRVLVRLFGKLVAVVATGCLGAREEDASLASEARVMLQDPDHPGWRSPAPDSFEVQFVTNKGSIVARARRDWAPIGTDRFYNLVKHGYYDDQRIFRVRAGFIAQFGISGDPSVMRFWRDRTMPDDPVVGTNVRGSLAYAMTGPDTRTTQIYINLSDNRRLDDDGFAPIARIVSGMEVVDSLYAGYDETAGGGMRGGRQGPLMEGGNAYLDREFPKLDRIHRATITNQWGDRHDNGNGIQ